jgi:hypothetical protein
MLWLVGIEKKNNLGIKILLKRALYAIMLLMSCASCDWFSMVT